MDATRRDAVSSGELGFVPMSSVRLKWNTAGPCCRGKGESSSIVSHAISTAKEAPLGHGELILVVEDNDTVQKATVSRLESLGYAILEAKSGPEAITFIASVGRAHCPRVQRHRHAWRHDRIRPGRVGSLEEIPPQGIADLRIQGSGPGERGLARHQSAWEALHTGAAGLCTTRSTRRLNSAARTESDDPNVWSGRASQEASLIWFSVLHQ